MFLYTLRRLLLVIPTLLGILTINFFIVQTAPGGPVEQFIAILEGSGNAFMERAGSPAGDLPLPAGPEGGEGIYSGARGLSPKTLAAVRELYGFDKPILVRYGEMLWNFSCFDFGKSLFKADSVTGLLADALPVSVSLGLWSTLIIYFVSIPAGIARAIRRGSAFDVLTGALTAAASAIPGFLFAVLLIVLFAGGSYWQIFPLRGLHTLGYENFTFFQQVTDYLHHMALPVFSLSIGGFAGLTLLTRNSFLDELAKQYVETARSKGLVEKKILYGHVFRNAMLIVISGLPGAFVRMFFTGSLLIETVFSLNGLGLLGFEAAMQRDYPVMFATLYIFTLIGLVTSIIGDLTMTRVDPRIDFAERSKA